MKFVLHVVNFLIQFVNFFVVVIGYTTNQWLTYFYSCNCPEKCFDFIGLQRSKYTSSGECSKYSAVDVDCYYLGLHGTDCDTFKNARQAAAIAVAVVVVMLLFSFLLVIICKMGTKPRVLWILSVIAIGVNLILALLCFVAVGCINDILDKGYMSDYDFTTGYGWDLFLGGGFAAMCSVFILVYATFFVNTEEAPADPVKTENTV